MSPSPIDIQPADTRAHTQLAWLDSHHSFNFGGHHQPGNDGHGLLIVSNDDTVAPSGGFGAHPHHNMEIVTWVLEGRLAHADSEGNRDVIYPGLAQRMTAGSGIMHAEMNASDTEPVHFVQMWVVPDEADLPPDYAQTDLNDALASGELVPVASGQHHPGAISINQAGATMWVGRLPNAKTIELPDAPFVHVYVASGSLRLGDDHLERGDAARLTLAGPSSVTTTHDSEIIIWETDTEVSR